MGNCWMCMNYTGDCGHHRIDSKGHIDYESSQYADAEPECFEVSPEHEKVVIDLKAKHIATHWSVEVIRRALEIAEEDEKSHE